MEQKWTIPLYVNDLVIKSYNLPLIGKVEIRQFADNQQYFALVSGVEFDLPKEIKDITAVKKSLETLLFNLASEKQKRAKERYDEINNPFLELQSTIKDNEILNNKTRSWLDNYKEK